MHHLVESYFLLLVLLAPSRSLHQHAILAILVELEDRYAVEEVAVVIHVVDDALIDIADGVVSLSSFHARLVLSEWVREKTNIQMGPSASAAEEW